MNTWLWLAVVAAGVLAGMVVESEILTRQFRRQLATAVRVAKAVGWEEGFACAERARGVVERNRLRVLQRQARSN